jgi:regulatory protein
MPAGIITKLEAQKRNKQRVNIYLDGEYAFSLTVDDATRLRKGQQLDEAQAAALLLEDELQRAVDLAARFLSYRPRSTHEVRHNLAQKAFSPSVIDAALARLEQLGYLNDADFAAFWVRERNTFKPLSQRALRFELRQKGVPDAIIDEALAALDAATIAYRAAERQAQRLRGTSRRVFQEKLLALLQRRGFAYHEAKTAVRQLEETLDMNGDFFSVDDASEHDLILPDAND